MHTPFTLWMNFLHIQMMCIIDLFDCVNSHTVIILYVLFCFCMFFDMFYILLSGDSLRDLWNVHMYVTQKEIFSHVLENSMLQGWNGN